MKSFSLLIILAVMITAQGCGSFKMAIGDDLKPAHDEYAVKGRQGILIKQKLGFGEFNTSVVKRSWTKGSSGYRGFGLGTPGTNDYTNIISVEHVKRRQTIFFSMIDAGNNVSEVYCASHFRSKDVTIGNPNNIVDIVLDLFGKGGHSESNYYVQIYTAENEQPWQMIIDNQAAQTSARSYTGLLALDKQRFYTIVPVTKIEKNGKTGNMLAGSVGFEFRDVSGRVVAAVSLMNNGMVFMGRLPAAERFLLANACAALLLQEEIS